MKKVGKSLVLLALGATAICGLAFVINKPSETTLDVAAITPDEYYSSVDTSTREKLMDTLESRLNNGAVDLGYDGLWQAYKTTDVKPGTNILWDMYSNESYTTTDSRINKNYSKEGDSVNREHSIPQSWFNEKSPMKADLFHVYPTDGYVNNRRSNYPHGEVGSATYTSKNGSKLGSSNTSGISGTVFEPIDEYKGDFARTYFYMATRYASKVGSWSGAVFCGGFPHINSNYIELYYKWHLNDPVSTKETDRNDAAFLLQKNRNPYIDHPEWAGYIFKGVEPGPTKTLTGISVSGTPSKTSYYEGESFQTNGLTVTATYSNDTTENVTSKVTVSPNPLTLGTTSVTLSYTYASETRTAVVSGITVNPVVPVTSVTINNTKTNYFIGESCDIETTVLPSEATVKTLTYSTSNASVASVDSTGHVLFKAAGSVTITAQSNNGKKDTITFNVTKRQISVTGIEASLPSSSYFVGDTANIQYTVLPTNADNKSVSFSSSNTSIASVTSTGSVSFNSAGDVILTVKSNEDQSIAATIDVTVSEKPVVEVPVDSVIFDSVKSKVEVGETVQLFANIYPENATNKTLTYSSSDNNIAEVSASGLVTFKAAGSVTITAKSHNDKTATMIFKVSAVPTPESKLFEIAITNKPSKLVYSVGETFSESGLEVKAHYLDGSSKEITSEVVVSTPDTSTAGSKKVTVSYNDTFTTEFEIAVVEETVSQLRITKFPLKTNYFPTEEFSPLGLKASAKFNEEVRDVSELVTFQYNFSVSNRVLVCFKNLSVNIEVTIESGEITDDHKAADFAYIVQNKVADVDDIQAVTINDWNSFEYNYNTLDEGAKQVLKSIVTDYSGGAANAENQLTEKLTDCVKKYDLTYLDHKDEGFNDFMGRNPQDNAQDKKGTDKKLIIALVGIGVGVIVLVTIIIIVAVAVSKKGKKKNA